MPPLWKRLLDLKRAMTVLAAIGRMSQVAS